MDSQIVRVVGAIIQREDTVFAARRNPERSAGGLWEFPGGKVEPGETPERALTRELQEELAINVTIGALIDRSTSNVAGKTIELFCYEASLLGPGPSSSTDHDAMAWVGLDQLHELAWAPGDIPIIERLPQRLRNAPLSQEKTS